MRSCVTSTSATTGTATATFTGTDNLVTVTLTNSTKTATYTVVSKMAVTEAPVDGKGTKVNATVGSPYTGTLVTYTDVSARDPAKGYPQIWEVYGAIVRNFGTTDFGARVLANVFDVSDVPWFGAWEARNIEQVLHPETVAATVGYCLLEADVRDDLAAIAAPTLVVQGSRTWDGRELDPAEDPSLGLMRERIADLEGGIIAEAHPGYVYVQQPERAAAAAEAFLDAHPLPAP